MIRRRHVLSSVGRAEISPEVAKLSRRRLLRNCLSLGSLALEVNGANMVKASSHLTPRLEGSGFEL